MTPKQKMDYVIQIVGGLVASTGNPAAAKSHIRNIVELVNEVETALTPKVVKAIKKKSAKRKSLVGVLKND